MLIKVKKHKNNERNHFQLDRNEATDNSNSYIPKHWRIYRQVFILFDITITGN